MELSYQLDLLCCLLQVRSSTGLGVSGIIKGQGEEQDARINENGNGVLNNPSVRPQLREHVNLAPSTAWPSLCDRMRRIDLHKKMCHQQVVFANDTDLAHSGRSREEPTHTVLDLRFANQRELCHPPPHPAFGVSLPQPLGADKAPCQQWKWLCDSKTFTESTVAWAYTGLT